MPKFECNDESFEDCSPDCVVDANDSVQAGRRYALDTFEGGDGDVMVVYVREEGDTGPGEKLEYLISITTEATLRRRLKG